jgi:hypothetical protein
MAKSSTVSAKSFVRSSVNPLQKTFKCFLRLLGKHSLSRTAVFEWHSRFKAGRVSVEDGERSGRPSTNKMTENVDKIRELI